MIGSLSKGMNDRMRGKSHDWVTQRGHERPNAEEKSSFGNSAWA
ncbi:hypothetical protein GCM10011409_32030 [Lentibacillus populi]|uniref:Uncharacterized protein n=1 Tax=Lentibacillus populi TaxID=1827502 RepID=A0A9W5TZB3_9BACI|nr:hypothetical protein GCM10011409_32030 [Lentibacillus populi]